MLGQDPSQNNNINTIIENKLKPISGQTWKQYINVSVNSDNVNEIEFAITNADEVREEKPADVLKFGEVCLSLGKYHAIRVRNYDKAIEFLSRAHANLDPMSMHASSANNYIAFCFLALNQANYALSYLERTLKNYENNRRIDGNMVRVIAQAHTMKASAVTDPDEAINSHRAAIKLFEDYALINEKILDDLYAETKCAFATHLVRQKKLESQKVESKKRESEKLKPSQVVNMLNPFKPFSPSSYFTLLEKMKNKFTATPINIEDPKRIYISLDKTYWSKKDCSQNYFAAQFYFHYANYFFESASLSNNKNPHADYTSALSRYKKSYNIAKNIEKKDSSFIKTLEDKISEVQSKIASKQQSQPLGTISSLNLLANRSQNSGYGSINNNDEVKIPNSNNKISNPNKFSI